jgi:RNA polymerase sigma factor (sigma-70 family)
LAAPDGLTVGNLTRAGNQTVTRNGTTAGGRDPQIATEPDLALLQRIASGDREAFQELFDAFYRRLSRFCTRLLSDPQLVEEVVNDTLMVVWRKAEGFSGRSQVSTWIFGIAYRLTMKALAARHLRAGAIESHGAVSGEAAPSIATQLEGAEDREVLEAALARLSPEHRAVLELAYFMGYSCAEIATIVECPVNTVKTRLFKARVRLRSMWPTLTCEAPPTTQETME